MEAFDTEEVRGKRDNEERVDLFFNQMIQCDVCHCATYNKQVISRHTKAAGIHTT